MPERDNEQLCVLYQKGDSYAANLLLENNLGFIRKTANEIYQNMNLSSSGIGIDQEDLEQEGSLGLLNVAALFDRKRNIKFLTYAAPAIRNAMMDCIRAGFSQFEQRIADNKNSLSFQLIRLDEVLPDEERKLRMETIADSRYPSPEEIFIKQETLQEFYDALKKLSAREQTYLLYRYGFTDETEHPLIASALHFHLSESRAKQTEEQALDNLWLELPWWF